MSAYTELPDDQLIDLLRTGSEPAFSEIYNRYWEKIFMLAANALKNPEEAEECVQDIFCSIWQRRETLHLKYSLYTYLAVAVKYRVINILDKEFRKRKWMELSPSPDFEILSPSAEMPLLEKEMLARLEASILLLPEKCQIVYRMSREEGKTRKEIANELNISEKTVNNHLTKAFKDLSGNLNAVLPAFLATGLLHQILHKN